MEVLRVVLPYTLSVMTITVMWLAGSKNWWAWVVQLVNQVGWLTFVVLFETWGLLPTCFVLALVAVRNLRRWRRDERHVEEVPA